MFENYLHKKEIKFKFMVFTRNAKCFLYYYIAVVLLFFKGVWFHGAFYVLFLFIFGMGYLYVVLSMLQIKKVYIIFFLLLNCNFICGFMFYVYFM